MEFKLIKGPTVPKFEWFCNVFQSCNISNYMYTFKFCLSTIDLEILIVQLLVACVPFMKYFLGSGICGVICTWAC